MLAVYTQSLVFVVHTLGMLFCGRNRHSRFPNQLHQLRVHADDGKVRTVGFFVGVQHLFHSGDELSIAFRRDHPVLDLSFCHAVFYMSYERFRG
jgi:hypothetical protein